MTMERPVVILSLFAAFLLNHVNAGSDKNITVNDGLLNFLANQSIQTGGSAKNITVNDGQLNFLANQSTQTGVCPIDFVAWGGNCYYASSYQAISFDQAESNCKELGAHLTSIHSKQENEFVFGLIKPKICFIGLYKDAGTPTVDANFKWNDGSQRMYTNWYPGHPNKSPNDKLGVYMAPDIGAWFDYYATMTSGFTYVCKIPGLPSTITPTTTTTTTITIPTTITPTTTPTSTRTPTINITTTIIPITSPRPSATYPTTASPTSHTTLTTTRKAAPVIYRPVPDMMVTSRCILDPAKICNASPGCEPRSLMADKDNCTNFLRCGIDGKWYAEPCPKGRRYDYRSCICSWSWMAACFTPTLCPVITA